MAAAAIATHILSDTERDIIATKVHGDFQTAELKVTPILDTSGYLGEYFRVEMTISDKDDPLKTTVHHFFMKTQPPEGGWATELMRENRLFEKEVNFYKDISGLFRKLISTEVYPECFIAAPGKIILLDASTLGYRQLADVRQPLDVEHTKQAVLALARFHSATLIYEEQNGRKIGVDFPDSVREPCYKSGTLASDFLETGGRAVASLAPHLAKYKNDPEAVSQVRDNVRDFMLKLLHYFKEETPFRKAICHGDSWPGNFLFKYDNDGTPLSAMLIDFQMIRYRPPAYELIVVLYLSLSLGDLKKWRETLMDLYYETVAGEIRNSGLDADSVYSRDEFRQTCIYYQIVGVIYSLLFFPFSRIGPDRMAQVVTDREIGLRFYYDDRGDHLIESYNTIPIVRESMDSCVEEMYENFLKTKRGYTEFTP